RPRTTRPTTHVLHPNPAHRPPPRHRAGGFFPLTDSPPTSATPSPRSSPAPTPPDDSVPTPASPNEPAAPSSPESASTTTTSGTDRHPKSDSPACKVNGIGVRSADHADRRILVPVGGVCGVGVGKDVVVERGEGVGGIVGQPV